MGFSIVGTVIGILIIFPSIIFFTLFPPKNVNNNIKEPSNIFVILERIGQVACLMSLVISKDFFQLSNINVFVILMVVCILIYYGLWIRYVVCGRDSILMSKPFLFIPIPGAVFPVGVFGFAALWGGCIWLGISTVILAIGHFAVTWNSYTQAN